MSKINAGQAPSTLISEYIGSDFDAVLGVADSIEAVKRVAKALESPDTFKASESTAGIAEIATQEEVNQKTNDSHIVTPKKLGVYAAPLVHDHATATPTESGFLAATDKQKLDGIASNANNYIHPTTDGNLHVPATGTDNKGKLLKAGATAGSIVWDTISKTDVGLSNVDNTSDLDKPVSTATQAALDGKSATDHTHNYLPLTGGTLTGDLQGTTFIGALAGNASTATSADKLIAARTISLIGDVIGSVSFDGSTDVTFATSYKASGVTAGTYKSVTVDEKGYITAGTNPTTLAEYGITDAAALSHVGSTGTAHGIASTSAAGFMSAADKIKLNGISGTNTGDQTITLTGDVTGSGTGSFAATLANSGVTAGSYSKVTVDTKGRVTAGASLAASDIPSLDWSKITSGKPTTLSGYGITNAVLASDVVTTATANKILKLDANSKLPTSITGNADGNSVTATKLETARTINGVLFDGSADIVINAVDSTSRIASSEKGVANGVATLGADGKIFSSQLPSYVDDILEYTNLAAFPTTGEVGKIYVALDTNKTYRWAGSVYVYITSGAVDSVAGKTGVVTLVKDDVGLSNVDNTSDLSKPISTAQQSALDLKANLASPVLTGTPSAPTAAVGTSTTQIATTAFVNAEIANDAAPKSHVGSTGTAHGVASTSVAGFMSSADKTKLNGIATGANAYVHPTGDGNLHVPVTGTNSDGYVLKAGAVAGSISWEPLTATDVGALPSTWVPNFSDINSKPTTLSGYGITDAQPLDPDLTSIAGLAGTTGLLKKTAANTWALDTNTYLTTNKTITISGDAAGTGSTAISLVLTNSGVTAGTYKSVTVDSKGRVTSGANPTTLAEYGITDATPSSHAGATGTAHGVATTLVAGFMSSSDKSKLDGISAGANAYTHPVSGVTAGTYRSVTVDVQGHITAGTNPTTLAGYGITDAIPSSLKGAVNGVATLDATGKVTASQLPMDAVQSVDGLTGVIELPLATEAAPGKAAIATTAEVTTGTNNTKFVTPAKLAMYAQPKDSTLTALAKVTTAADNLIYATAPDVFTTTSITPFARTLIDDVDAAAMRTTLGIDGLPILTFIGDTPPINPQNGITWYCTDDGRTYVYYVDSDSGQWIENSPQSPATTDTLRGTNVNGDYTKFADGTLICWVTTATSASATKAITYPMAFISNPVCTVTVEAATPFIVTTQFPSVTGIGINGWNMSSARVAVACTIMVVGRWK